jgi:hypothetical protein
MGGITFGKGILLIIGLGVPLITILLMSMISVDIGVLVAMVELIIFNRLDFLDVPMLQAKVLGLSRISWFIAIFCIFAILSLWRKMRRQN